jgi:hypothetical protein
LNPELGQSLAQYELILQNLKNQEAALESLRAKHAGMTDQFAKQVESLEQQNRLLKARENGTEASVSAAIAYENAIAAGANSTEAAAIQALTLKNNLLQAASAASNIQINLDWSEFDAQVSAAEARQRDPANASYFNTPSAMGQGGSTSEFSVPNPFLPSSIRAGASTDINLVAGAGESLKLLFEAAIDAFNRELYKEKFDDFKFAGTDADIRGAMGVRANELLGSDKREEKLQGMQMQLDALQMLYPTQTRLAEIEALQRAMEKLRNSVDENTSALNKVALNPLYNGRDALRVGYMGAASGLDMMVKGGIPGVDSVPIHIMAQQGERVQVTPANQAVSNDNTKSTIVNNTITVVETKSSTKRSSRQVGQKYGQLMASLS